MYHTGKFKISSISLVEKKSQKKKYNTLSYFNYRLYLCTFRDSTGALGSITKISSSSERENNSQPFDASLFESNRHAIIKHALASM